MLLDRGDQPVQRQVAEGVHPQLGGDLVHRHLRPQELPPGRHVDPVVAGMAHRRARHPEVHLRRSRAPDELDQAARGGAAHDRVVHHDHPLPGQDVAHRVVLDAGAEVAVGLRGADEGAAHVVVAEQPQLVGDAALLAVAERGGVGAVGHRDHAVAGHGVLARELSPEGPARAVHADPPQVRVGAREVHELEDAGGGGLGVEPRQALRPAVPELDELPRLEVAHEGGAHDVQRAGLAGDDVAVAEPAEHEGAEAARIAHRVHDVADGEHQRVGALQEAQRVADLGHDRAVAGACDEVHDHLRVRRALEDRALVDQLSPDRERVGEVAVVDDRQVALRVPDHHRLGVDPLPAARRRVAHVSERGVPRQRRDPLRVEDVRDQAELLVEPRPPAVGRADPGRLLAPVLEGVEREEGELGGVVDAVDPDDAALLARTVVQEGEVDVAGRPVGHHRAWSMIWGMAPK